MSSDSGLIRILLADSDELRSQMLTSALRRRSEFMVHACAMDADLIRRALLQSDVDVALICSDSRGPEICLPVIRSIHLARSHVGTVLLSETLTSELVVNAFRSGARAFLPRGRSSSRALQMYSLRA